MFKMSRDGPRALAVLPFLLLLAACPWDDPDPSVMEGYVAVTEPGGEVQKIKITCRMIYNIDRKTFSISGLSLPITSVIKPEIGGVSTELDPQAISDQLHGLDLQQLAMCESLLLLPGQPDMRQTLKDYVGAGGYLTQQIRTLSSSTSAAQYQQAAGNLAGAPTATVASTTEAAMATMATNPTARVQAPTPAVFSTSPSLNEPPDPANSRLAAPRTFSTRGD